MSRIRLSPNLTRRRLWTTPMANRSRATRQNSPTAAARPAKLPSSDMTCPSIARLIVQGSAIIVPLYTNMAARARAIWPR